MSLAGTTWRTVVVAEWHYTFMSHLSVVAAEQQIGARTKM